MAQRTGRTPVAPIVAAVVQPVTRRLARIEDLLWEMRHEEDVKLKRLDRIQNQLDDLAATVAANRRTTDRLSTLLRGLSRKPKAGSRKPEAGSRKPEAATLTSQRPMANAYRRGLDSPSSALLASRLISSAIS